MTQDTAAPPSTAYRADIDGLRAVAVLLVLVFHFDLVSSGKAGFIGVDVFFVISGFLITSIVKRQLDNGAFSIAAFYLGRVRRLAPALLAVLLMVLVAGAVLLFPDDFVELSRQVLVSQFYVANLYYWRNVNYFGLGTGNVFLLHTWSLAVEEQFYLLYPLAILCVHKYWRRYFWVAIAIGLLASFALNIAFVWRKPELTFYLLPTRAWELLAGALVPVVALTWRRTRAADQLLGAFGIGLIAAAVVYYRTDFRFPGFFALLPVAGAVCLLLSGGSSVTLTSRCLSLAPITYIGKISYPLYLVHWPVNVLASRWWTGEQYVAGLRLAMFAVSILLAAAVYHLVENPIRHRRLLAVNKRLMLGYAAGLGTTVAMFALVMASSGLPQRFPDEVSRLASYVNDKSPPLKECAFVGQALSKDSSFCRIGASTDKPKWLVYGDSHAWAAYEAFDKWLKLKGESGLFMYHHSCPPVMGLHVFGDKGRCFDFNRSVADFLSTHVDVSNVVLVSTWRQADEARLSTAEDIHLSREQSVGLFDEKFSKTLAYLNRIGKHVYVWEPVPGASQSVPIAMARAALGNRPADIEFTLERYLSENAFFFSALEKNRRWVTVSFSPSEALCRNGRCAVTIGGVPAYFDNAHITRSPSDFWARMMQRSEQEAVAR